MPLTLRVGAPDHGFEREAERTADAVMRMPDTPARVASGDKIAAAPEIGTILRTPGRTRPNMARGRKLMAHELAHVVQQGAGADRPFAAVIEQKMLPRPQPKRPRTPPWPTSQ